MFYKLLNGNTREVSGFKNFLTESGIEDAILIADKGFYSKANIELLAANELKYIIPLRRNDNLIEYTKFNDAENAYFQYEDRVIWTTS